METLYIFLDEGGNLDFSPTGTPYFTLTSVTCRRPFTLNTQLDSYKYDLIEFGKDKQYFHCSEDNRHIREGVFSRIATRLPDMKLDSLIVEKRKTGPALREERRFYPEMLGYLLRYIIRRESGDHIEEIVVITDEIPLKNKRQAVEKAVKQTLSHMLPDEVVYRVLHHSSRAHYGLQVADYCNWAIYRKWMTDDRAHYNQIRSAIASEFEIFRSGKTYYY